ncbi:hypothetical protein SeLEV6574_g01607 [Synchytrium endobioticum]|uniref:Uncharacterized protein n=1 Tax=Synchytrium endobioticum TaxID=286115 RepID=A0A507DC79_9FUNG|nr:hypothetical protein SeLEV6574_g01607 [Synchytrium endobioticum]
MTESINREVLNPSSKSNKCVLLTLESDGTTSASPSRFDEHDWYKGAKSCYTDADDMIPSGCYELLVDEDASEFLSTHVMMGATDDQQSTNETNAKDDVFELLNEAITLCEGIDGHKIETTPILQDAFNDCTRLACQCIKLLVELYQVSQATFAHPEIPPAQERLADPTTHDQFTHPSRIWRAPTSPDQSPRRVYLAEGSLPRASQEHKIRTRFLNEWLNAGRDHQLATNDLEKLLERVSDEKPRLGDSKEWVRRPSSPTRSKLRREFHLDW